MSPRCGRRIRRWHSGICCTNWTALQASSQRSNCCSGRRAELNSRDCKMGHYKPLDIAEPAPNDCVDRVGMARLAKLAFDGSDLRPIWADVSARLLDGEADAGEAVDLSLIAQLLGHKQTGLSIQHEVLASHRLFRL